MRVVLGGWRSWRSVWSRCDALRDEPAGSTTGYQESVVSPRPVPTVVKHRTKIVHKPAKTKVVYVTPARFRPTLPQPRANQQQQR